MLGRLRSLVRQRNKGYGVLTYVWLGSEACFIGGNSGLVLKTWTEAHSLGITAPQEEPIAAVLMGDMLWDCLLNIYACLHRFNLG